MQKRASHWLFFPVIVVFALIALLGAAYPGVRTQQSAMAAEGKEQPNVIEYYYKAKWGHAEEFLALFKKNHYPVLKKEIELGRMLKVSMTVPRYHTTEDGRWDYRVTIVFKSAAVANDNFDSSVLIKQLYPDQSRPVQERRGQLPRTGPVAATTSMMGFGSARMVWTKSFTMAPSNCAFAQRSSSARASVAVRAFLYVRSLVIVS